MRVEYFIYHFLVFNPHYKLKYKTWSSSRMNYVLYDIFVFIDNCASVNLFSLIKFRF